MLFGVPPLDLPTFALVTVLVGHRAVAIAGPAWRAANRSGRGAASPVVSVLSGFSPIPPSTVSLTA